MLVLRFSVAEDDADEELVEEHVTKVCERHICHIAAEMPLRFPTVYTTLGVTKSLKWDVMFSDLLLQPYSLPAGPVCARGPKESFWQGHQRGHAGLTAGTFTRFPIKRSDKVVWLNLIVCI